MALGVMCAQLTHPLDLTLLVIMEEEEEAQQLREAVQEVLHVFEPHQGGGGDLRAFYVHVLRYLL